MDTEFAAAHLGSCLRRNDAVGGGLFEQDCEGCVSGAI